MQSAVFEPPNLGPGSGDLIFGLLATQSENAWLGAVGVSVELLLGVLLIGRLCLFRALDDGVDVDVLVPGG